MGFSQYTIGKIRGTATFIVLGSFFGGLFAYIMSAVLSGDFSFIVSAPYVLMGTFTGLGVSAGVLALNDAFLNRALRPLWFSLIVTPFLQTLIIVAVYVTSFVSFIGFDEFLENSYLVQTIFFSLTLSFIFNTFSDLERLLGRHVLRGLLWGTYKRPRNEDRFVMFLDIAGSTSIAEELGGLAFHAFLNDFFCDIARPIVNHHGDIYKYVGDEAIITWPRQSGARDANALAVFFAIDTLIKRKSSYYEGRYGVVPDFRCGLHYGSVVAGEMGLTRQEIAFSGDVMNTTARIQAECRQRGERLLASSDALALLGSLEAKGLAAVPQGPVALRGKSNEIAIFAVRSS
jgi:class 3 adenylate cyclase